MYNTANQNGKVVKGSPGYFQFYTSGTIDTTKTIWSAPGFTRVGTSNGAPVAIQDGTTGVYHSMILPVMLGPHYLAFRDSSNVILAEAWFECIPSSEESYVLGLTTKQDAGYATIWPSLTQVNPTATGTQRRTGSGAGTKRAYISTGKYVVPMTGLIIGISMYARASSNPTALDDFWFFTADPTTFRAKSRSDNIKNLTPIDNAWAVGDNFKTVLFNRPVAAEAGDVFGFWADDTTAGGGTAMFRSAATQATASAAQSMKTFAGDLSFTGANAFVEADAPLNEQPQVKLLMLPPLFAVCGLSIYAGSTNSTPIFANRSGTFAADQDPATMLSKILGVPVINCGWGGSESSAWVGASGYFETYVKQLNPSMIGFDCAYNDAVAGVDADTHRDNLDRMLVHCDQAGITLALFEPYVPKEAVDVKGQAVVDRLESLRQTANLWARQNGITVFPSYYRLGEYYGSGALSTRWQQKNFGTDHPTWGLPDYGYSADAWLHLTQAGRKAMAQGWADHIRRGCPLSDNPYEEITFDPNLVPANSQAKIAQSARAGTQVLLIEA